MVIDRGRLDYNHHRINRALDYQIPAAFDAGWLASVRPPASPQHASRATPHGFTQAGA